jgi:hypothetical protein
VGFNGIRAHAKAKLSAGPILVKLAAKGFNIKHLAVFFFSFLFTFYFFYKFIYFILKII